MNKIKDRWSNLLLECDKYNNSKSHIPNIIPPRHNPYVSIVIPCINYHFTKEYFRPCLDSIFNGTIIPNEIIIVVSFIKKDEFNIRWNKINKYNFYNNFKIIYISQLLSCGEARQKGIELSYKDSEIVIFCDADDVYHRQRIEVIIHFFKTYDIKVINHLFIPDTYSFDDYVIDKIPILSDSETIYNHYFPDKTFKPFCQQSEKYYGQYLNKTITDGHMAIKLPIDMKFENKTVNCDSDFLYRLCYRYKKNLIIGACLSKYTKALEWLKNDPTKKIELYNSLLDCQSYSIKYI